MQPIEPNRAGFILPSGTTRQVYAENQAEYIPLPSLRTPDGRVVSQWEPTAEEIERLKAGEPLTLVIHTFNQRLQPIALAVGALDLTHDGHSGV